MRFLLIFDVHGVQLHRTYFAYLLACALGSILLLLLEVTLKKARAAHPELSCRWRCRYAEQP